MGVIRGSITKKMWVRLETSQMALVIKNPPANAGDMGLIPGSGRFPGEGNGNPLQYSCLENPMDGGTGWATAHGVAKSETRLTSLSQTLVCIGITGDLFKM